MVNHSTEQDLASKRLVYRFFLMWIFVLSAIPLHVADAAHTPGATESDGGGIGVAEYTKGERSAAEKRMLQASTSPARSAMLQSSM